MATFIKPFNIIGYSKIKQLKPEDDMVVGIFDHRGHTWGITLSLNGRCHCSEDCMKLHVLLLTATRTEISQITLEVEYSLFDHTSKRYSVKGVNTATSCGKVSKLGDGVVINNFMNTRIFEKSDYLKDDCFKLKCYMKLVKPWCIEARKKQVIVPSSDFLQHFHQLWDSREGADVVFQVGEETFSAHRTVLAARSLVFKAEFFGPMLESKTACVKIEDIMPEIFDLMLHFMYTDTIPLNEELSFEIAQHLLVAADRYGLERLKLICEDKLSNSIELENATDILVFSDKHNCDQLKEICLNFVTSRKNRKAVIATDGFKHLMETCPYILKRLITVDCMRKK